MIYRLPSQGFVWAGATESCFSHRGAVSATCVILAAEARNEGKVTLGDLGAERQKRCMLLISEGEKGCVNAKDRWIGLKHVYFMSVFLCLGSIYVNTIQWRKVCVYNMIQMSETNNYAHWC